ncbi:hypothetical protein ACFVVM_26220 [Nocardia sp. NPDC058176]|uniref:hypothetical protein n=1 Tax=Nocardia sp. NPDC058176 TaxID=3346368 RepID=UPI0036D8D96D
MRRFPFIVAIAAVALLGAGCSDDSPTAPATTTTTTAPETTETAPHEQHTTPNEQPIPVPPTTVSMMPNPNGDGSQVPCEGTICTNPNHGAGPDPEENGGHEMPNPNGDGSEVPCEGTICTNPNHGGN